MAESKIVVEIGDLDIFHVARNLKNSREIFAALGTELFKEVYRNFEAEGVWRKWAPLRPNTKAGHRSGASAKALAKLRSTFREDHGKDFARVGSPSKIAKYHHEGRKGPWLIRPRKAKALAFPVAVGGRPIGFKEAFKSYGYKKRSAKFLSKTPFVVVQKVNHPGYPSRPMLPPISVALKLANEVIREMLLRGTSGD